MSNPNHDAKGKFSGGGSFKTKQKAFKHLIDNGFVNKSGPEWSHPTGKTAKVRKSGMSHIVEIK